MYDPGSLLLLSILLRIAGIAYGATDLVETADVLMLQWLVLVPMKLLPCCRTSI
jgi:hypothetical protein